MFFDSVRPIQVPIRGLHRMGQQGNPQGGGQGGAQGSPSPASPPAAAPSAQDTGPFFWPSLPLVSPLQYPGAPANAACAWEKDANGTDIYVCRPAAAPSPIPAPLYNYGPVSYSIRTFYPLF